MQNLRKAISYSLKPHELGYCGQQGTNSQHILRQFLLGKKYPEKLIRALLDEFKGAVNYFRLIARANNIQDYFDQQVIEAYWIGNSLLDKVKADDLKQMILTSFTKPQLLTKTKARQIVSRMPASVVAHHSFHVFFVGSITGRVEITVGHKDRCKVSWGEVTNIFNRENKVEVKTTKLFPGKKEVKIKIDWDKELFPQFKKGDLVSLHWGKVSERLTKREYNNLIKYTIMNSRGLYG